MIYMYIYKHTGRSWMRCRGAQALSPAAFVPVFSSERETETQTERKRFRVGASSWMEGLFHVDTCCWDEISISADCQVRTLSDI